MINSRGPAPSQLSAYILQTLQRPGQPALFEAFAALGELHARQPSLITGEHLASAARALIATETQPGGPYITQQFTEEGLLTNAAIALFMQQLGTPLPNVTAYLQQALGLQQSGQLTMSAEAGYYLARAANASYDIAARPVSRALPPAWQDAHQSIVNECEQHIARTPVALRVPLTTALRDILAADTSHEISLLPLFFLDALHNAQPSTISAKPDTPYGLLCQTLGVANIFCWIAYTAYDNILDNEPAATFGLPMANVAQRISYNLYSQAIPGRTAAQLVSDVFSAMDAANNWELLSCRAAITPPIPEATNAASDSIHFGALPYYGNRTILARRAFAHVLGPLLLLVQAGYSQSSPQFASIKQGLHHFLIARQLQDDLHDWSKDLRAGQLSFVVTDLLRQLRIRSGTYPLDELEARMKHAFWRHGLTRSCGIIVRHTRDARIAFKQSGIVTFTTNKVGSQAADDQIEHQCITSDNPLDALIHRLECAAIQAQHNYQQSQQFVSHYQ